MEGSATYPNYLMSILPRRPQWQAQGMIHREAGMTENLDMRFCVLGQAVSAADGDFKTMYFSDMFHGAPIIDSLYKYFMRERHVEINSILET